MKITSATIESVADTDAMFYLLQAPAEAATNAGAFLKRKRLKFLNYYVLLLLII